LNGPDREARTAAEKARDNAVMDKERLMIVNKDSKKGQN
jgi:hypothetical protein